MYLQHQELHIMIYHLFCLVCWYLLTKICPTNTCTFITLSECNYIYQIFHYWILSYSVFINSLNSGFSWLINDNSFMGLQITCLHECLVTLLASEWFFISVNSFMSLQIAWLTECLVALWAAERLLTCVDSFMGLQMTWLRAFVVTLGAAKWFITCVDSFMSL